MSPKKTTVQKISNAEAAFWYLSTFLALGFVAVGMGMLLFQIINFCLPDTTWSEWQYRSAEESAKFAVSSLVVTAPLYYFFQRHINRRISQKDLSDDSALRKWLTYAVLFVALAWLIGDVITLVYSFLDGELTLRFVLKVAIIAMIAGSVFVYYVTDIKNATQKTRRQRQKWWGIGFITITLMTLMIGSIVTIKTPSEVRKERADQRLEESLSEAKWSCAKILRNTW